MIIEFDLDGAAEGFVLLGFSDIKTWLLHIVQYRPSGTGSPLSMRL